MRAIPFNQSVAKRSVFSCQSCQRSLTSTLEKCSEFWITVTLGKIFRPTRGKCQRLDIGGINGLLTISLSLQSQVQTLCPAQGVFQDCCTGCLGPAYHREPYLDRKCLRSFVADRCLDRMRMPAFHGENYDDREPPNTTYVEQSWTTCPFALPASKARQSVRLVASHLRLFQ